MLKYMFLKKKFLSHIVIQIPLYFIPWGPLIHDISIGLDYGWMPNRCQSIVSADVGGLMNACMPGMEAVLMGYLVIRDNPSCNNSGHRAGLRLCHSPSLVVLHDCEWDMIHGLQMAYITLQWLAGLNTGLDCL